MIRNFPDNLGNSVAIATSLTLTLVLAWPRLWQNLLTVNSFIPHGHCYLWQPGLVSLHVISDSLIAAAYIAISTTLAYLVYKTRREIPFHWMFLAFGSFIVACGATHLLEIWTLWHPTYWLSGAVKLMTAIASVTTALTLPPLVPKALKLLETAKVSEERRLHLETANQELELLNDKLKELDQLKTQFFANVSHELRTPLALILGPVGKLLAFGELNETQYGDLKVVDRNARLLLKQVNDLLDVSKLEADQMGVHYTEVDLAQLVSLTAANFDGLAQERQVSFGVDVPDTLPAQVDAEKLQRVLLNLLSNAFKFTPPGGTICCVLSAVTANQPSLEASEETSDNPAQSLSLPKSASAHCAIAVRDSGPGVPPALRETIFERFSQGDTGDTRRFGGTGLGLAIVKEFVELHGGTVRVEDAPEGGGLFTVELPLVAPSNTAVSTKVVNANPEELILPLLEELRNITPARIASEDTALEKPLVLVVEDNPEMNQFIADTLRAEYRTAVAFDGQEGLKQALCLQPDLILSDVMMPHLSGDQLIAQVRQYPELATTPIVMLTAKADDELRVQLLRTGAQDYLMKPFSVEELRARVGNLVAIKRTRDLLQQELASQSQDLVALVEEVSLRRRDLQITLEALRQQATELEQANRLKNEFLAIVSHELRTPLNAILGWSQMLRTRQLNEKMVIRAIETIERNARLQTQLVEDLLDVSRLLQGKLSLYKHQVDLKPVIQTVVQTLQPTADSKGIQLEAVLTHPMEVVTGDSDRLQQIVEKLLTNAIKFTPEGGRVIIYLEQQDSQATIRVYDTGQGINSEFLPYVFDYFRQGDSSITRTHGGLGLGLAIVKQLVQLHDGSIQVESLGEGLGTTVTVQLPLAKTNSPQYLV